MNLYFEAIITTLQSSIQAFTLSFQKSAREVNMSSSISSSLSPKFILDGEIEREKSRIIAYETHIDIVDTVAAVSPPSTGLADESEMMASGGTMASAAAQLDARVDPQTDDSNTHTDHFYKVIAATFANTAAAGYSMLGSTSPTTKGVVVATAAGFFGTLTAMSLRDKFPGIARSVGKVGVLAGTIGVIGCYGMQLPSDVYWAVTCGVAAAVPAAAVFYA